MATLLRSFGANVAPNCSSAGVAKKLAPRLALSIRWSLYQLHFELQKSAKVSAALGAVLVYFCCARRVRRSILENVSHQRRRGANQFKPIAPAPAPKHFWSSSAPTPHPWSGHVSDEGMTSRNRGQALIFWLMLNMYATYT